jgi:hypothetical protein
MKNFMKVIIKQVNIFLSACSKGRFQFQIGLVEQKEQKHMEIKITNEQKIKVSINPLTATGKPAKLDGKPTWTVQSGDSQVIPAEDGLSASFVSSDTPGVTVVLLEADADLGEGVEKISDSIELNVIGANASSFGLVVGTPEAK